MSRDKLSKEERKMLGLDEGWIRYGKEVDVEGVIDSVLDMEDEEYVVWWKERNCVGE